MNQVKVGILGGSGYTAVELMKILLRHPHAEIVAVTSRQDEHVADLHPSLFGRLDLRCEPFEPDKLKAKGVRVAFGCLPHGTSMESIPPLLERGIRVVDLSADYRHAIRVCRRTPSALTGTRLRSSRHSPISRGSPCR